MNRIKISATAMVLMMAFSSCHLYVKRFAHKAKREVGASNISRHKDTVRVIYPELTMFDFGKDEIKPEARMSLQRMSGVLTRFGKMDFWINGYTDNVGTMDVNQSLSQRRADNTKMLFNTNGVSADRMTTTGQGPSNPIADNSTEAGRQVNRRVELVLYKRSKNSKK